MNTRFRFDVRSLLTLALMALFASTSSAFATEWFVAPGGTGPGTSDQPMGRIQDALSRAVEGDTITVRPGTYAGPIVTVRHASAARPIVLRAETARTAIITASGNVLAINHAYHVIDGFVLDGQYGPDRILKVGNDADNSVVRNTEVRRAARDCVSIASPDNFLIDKSLIHHCLNSTGGRTDAHGISAESAQNLTVRDTEIHTFSGDGIQVDPTRRAPGWDRLTIEGARIWLAPLPEAVAGFAAGTVTGENAVDTKVYNSGYRARLVVRNTTAWGFRSGIIGNMAAFNIKENVDAVLDGVTVRDSEIAFRLRGPAWVTLKNAVAYNVAYGVRYEDNIPQLRVWNTTFGAGVGQSFLAASSTRTGLEVSNVLVLGASLPVEASGASNRAVSAATFVNSASNDYHLAAGSIAVNAGASMTDVATDREGTARPQGGYFDIGAYEYCATSPCGATPPPPPPTPAPCAYSISPTTRSAPAAGETGTITVTTTSGCAWTASTAGSWMTLGTASGTGSGTVSYTVGANTTTTARTATATIAGLTFTLAQAGTAVPPPPAPCSYSVSSTAVSLPATGGTGTISVSATAGCAWTASSAGSWFVLGSTGGTGAGSVTYTAAANTSTTSRTAIATIAGQSITVMQAAAPVPPPPGTMSCTYSVSPRSQSFAAAGGSGTVTITASSSTCAWTVTAAGATWITVPTTSGAGTRSVSYSVATNTSTSPRTATITVAGVAVTISQAGAVPVHTTH